MLSWKRCVLPAPSSASGCTRTRTSLPLGGAPEVTALAAALPYPRKPCFPLVPESRQVRSNASSAAGDSGAESSMSSKVNSLLAAWSEALLT